MDVFRSGANARVPFAQAEEPEAALPLASKKRRQVRTL
jgi:hypothetical protein